MNSLPSFEELRNVRMKTLELQSNITKDYSDKYAKVETYNQQLEQFKNMVITTQKPSYNELFIAKQIQPIGDPTLHQNALLSKHLLTIADAENAQQLLNRLLDDLSAEQIKNLNSRWTGFTHELRKNFEKGIEKDTLVSFVLEFLSEKSKPIAISKQLNEGKEKVKSIRVAQQKQAVIQEIKGLQPVCNPKSVSTLYTNPINAQEVEKLGIAISEAYKGEGCIARMQQFLEEQYSFHVASIPSNTKGIALKRYILSQFQRELTSRLSRIESIEGKGKTKARVYKTDINFIEGGGAVKIKESDEKYMKLNKYMINLEELKHSNLLVVKYVKNHQNYQDKRFPKKFLI